jgi:flagellar biosynthetic protein FliR
LIFIHALGDSFVSAPVAQFPALATNGSLLVDRLARFSADTFLIALKLSAPVLIALFLIDACFGALGKIAPQVPVHGEAHTLKGLAALAIILLGLPLLIEQFGVSMIDMLAGVRDVIGLVGGA